jgi:protein-disulfide isomerase
MRVSSTLEDLVKEYDGKLKVVYKNYVVHPDTAMVGHMAACAAGNQDKFHEFKRAFWEKAYLPYAQSGGNPETMMEDNVLKIAAEVGLDTGKLKADMAPGSACEKRITDDMRELQNFNVGFTPAFFVNGTFTGFKGEPALKAMIDEKLKIAEASGVSAEDYYQKEIFEKGEKKFRSMKDPKPTN